ncbi:hypothetical protein [Lactococcus protaetiae]|uniref:Uncharacterized protein n=1 Tax=Lactococcus protaetiae TaxID=2592653 RepID=A0A514Z768_9LACT|nr:hypothetical protein [Lactococcus protaetiae]MCL2112391.1 hypothetical protein [Streptococcaceae bacterium]QDK70431.1 hypothetical protein FLP15_03650 [Lactococcus protaetiae]
MSTWGVAFISLGLLLVAYRNWFGLVVIILGAVMMIVARNNKKKAAKLEQEKLREHRETEIKSRK